MRKQKTWILSGIIIALLIISLLVIIQADTPDIIFKKGYLVAEDSTEIKIEELTKGELNDISRHFSKCDYEQIQEDFNFSVNYQLCLDADIDNTIRCIVIQKGYDNKMQKDICCFTDEGKRYRITDYEMLHCLDKLSKSTVSGNM